MKCVLKKKIKIHKNNMFRKLSETHEINSEKNEFFVFACCLFFLFFFL